MSTREEAQSVRIKRAPRGGTRNPPVWSLDEPLIPEEPSRATSAEQVPLQALCAQHERNSVCCKSLKGSDERNLLQPELVRNFVIGFSDGITVPFGLTAGLASLGNSKLVIVGGIAELISGAISMGIGGYLASQADKDLFQFLRHATHERVQRSCLGELDREVYELLGHYGIDRGTSRRIATSLIMHEAENPYNQRSGALLQNVLQMIARRPRTMDLEKKALDADRGMTAFLLKLGEGLEDLPTIELYKAAITIAVGYLLGGIVPLIPYFASHRAIDGLHYSILVTGVVLILFGMLKTYYTGARVGPGGYAKGSLQMLAVGATAAAASYGVVKGIDTAYGIASS